ncbi:MAG: site-specific integrase [Croceibacterium sp.]
MEEVGKPTGLVRRKDSASWQFRQRWPKHLRRPGDPAEVWISLETTSHQDALRKLPEAREALQRRFNHTDQQLERSGIYSRTPLRAHWPCDESLELLRSDQAAPLARAYFAEAIRSLDADVPVLWAKGDSEWRSWRAELDDRLARLTGPETASSDGSDDLVMGEMISVLHKAGLRAYPSSEACNLLHNYLRRAMAQTHRIMLSRWDGDYSDLIEDDLFARRSCDPPMDDPAAMKSHIPVGVEAQTLEAASERYLATLLAKPTQDKTKDRYRAELKHIVAFFGRDMPVWRLNANECERFRDSFALLPPNFEDKIRTGKEIATIVATRADGDPVLAWATLDKYLSQLTRFLKWAHKRDYVAKNYAEDLKPLTIKPDGSMAKLPFEDVELLRIFHRPIYIGCLNDRRGFGKAGSNIIRRARYWAPLIALFSGLRCGEILQLTTAHFRVSPNGNDFIALTPDMKLKNENAVREIPLHPLLKAIGLVEWVQRRRDRGELALFPEVPAHSSYDDQSTRFSKWYESDLRHFGLGERRAKLSFHSYRHTFKRALDRADVSEDKKEEICGWARGKKTSRRYGTGLEADVLKPSVEAVVYGVDFSHLYVHARLDD